MRDVESIEEMYRIAGKSQNTHDTYLQAVKHYRETCGNMLPASPKEVRTYLAEQAGRVKLSTMRVRLAGLSKWHKSQGFYDPTSSDSVKEVMKGIAKVHRTKQKQATPLTFSHLQVICDYLEAEKLNAIQLEDHNETLRLHRDLAIVLCGFWQGFRSDELSRISVSNVTYQRDGMTVFFPYTKADKSAEGREFHLPRLKLYCPVTAFRQWIELAGIKEGAAFRKIDRWGNLGAKGINKRTIESVLQKPSAKLFPDAPKFTTHSLRHGFADWAVNNGWDERTIMEHVGWRSVASARRYMPARRDYGDLGDTSEPIAISGLHGVSEGDHGNTFIARAKHLDQT